MFPLYRGYTVNSRTINLQDVWKGERRPISSNLIVGRSPRCNLAGFGAPRFYDIQAFRTECQARTKAMSCRR